MKKVFLKIHKKTLVQSYFLVAGPWPETLLKRESNGSVFLCFPGKEFKKPSLQMVRGKVGSLQYTSGRLLLKNFTFTSVMLLIGYLFDNLII